jgi:PAS domain S-box-containing protein
LSSSIPVLSPDKTPGMHMRSKVLKHVLTITLSYLIIGVLYIAFSDKIVHSLSLNEEMLTRIQTLKGWGFILLTSIWLFVLLYRYFNNLEKEKTNLKTSEEKWRSLVTNSPDYIALLDRERRFLFVNKYPEGFTSEQVIGTDSIDYFSDEYKEQFKIIFNKCLLTRTTQKFEVKAFGNNRSIRHYEEYIVPLLSDNDDITFLVIARDITDRKLFEIKLKESEERWRSLVTNSPDYIALLDEEGKFLFINNYPEGFDAEKVIGTYSYDYFSDDYKETYEKIFKYCSETKTTQKFEFKAFGAKYTLRDYEEYLVPIPTADNKLNFLAIARDITDRKYFEDALKVSEEKYRTLIENTQEAIYIAQDGKIKYVNRSALNITGRTESELLEHEITEFVPEEDHEFTREHHLRLISGEISESQTEYRLKHIDGRIIDLLVNSVLIQWNNKPGTLNFASDITERKQFEKALTQSEEKYRSLSETAKDIIIQYSLTGEITYLNPAGLEYLDYLKTEPIKTIYHFIPEKYHKQLKENAEQRIAGFNGHRLIEIEIIGRNNKTIPVEVNSTPIFVDDKIIGMISIVRDITERKNAEQELKSSEERYRTITENIKDVVWVLDTNTGKFLYVSPSVFKLRGYTAEEIISQPVSNALTPESVDLLNRITAERINKFLITGVSEYYVDEIEQPCKDGSTVWTEVVTNFYISEETGHVEVRGVSRDINERKQIQDALKESEQRFRTTLDNMLEGCQILDSNWTYTYINDAAEKQNHRPKSELLGNEYLTMWPGIEHTKVYRLMKDCMQNKISHQFENEFTYPDGSVGWFDLSIQPVPEGIFILSIDITEKKKAELEILNSRENLRALYARLQRIREEERINLSRELHDHLGQNLTGLKMDVAYIAKHIALKSEIDTDTFLAKTTGMSFLIDDLIKNVRKISSELRPNVLDYLGLVPAIEWYVEDFKRRTEMECIYTSNTQKIDLSMEINSSIFRIIQEAFTNIIRHAHASIVKLTIDEHTEFIKITIHDNGIGINQNILNEYKSLGILGMKERTLNFSGKLNIVKAKEGGTTLTLIIPKR